MKVNRIVANIPTDDIAQAKQFYHDILGLEVLMDHGWLVAYGSAEKMTVQVGVATQGGSGTPVPDLSIEVDDVEVAREQGGIRRRGVVVQHVEPAEGLHRRFDHRRDRRLVRDVGLLRTCASAGCGDLGDDLLRAVAVHVRDQHAGAFGRQRVRGRAPDARRRARDEHHLAFEATHRLSYRAGSSSSLKP